MQEEILYAHFALKADACLLFFSKEGNFQKPFATCRVSRILNLIDKKLLKKIVIKIGKGGFLAPPGDSEPFYLVVLEK